MPVLGSMIDHIPTGTYGRAEVVANKDASYGSETGPFVVIHAYATGDRFFINTTTAADIARVIGWSSPDDVAILKGQLSELAADKERLEQELAEERSDKVVPLAEVVDFFTEKAKRRPDTVAAE